MSLICTLCPAHQENAGDYEIVHGSVRYVIYVRQRDIKMEKNTLKLVDTHLRTEVSEGFQPYICYLQLRLSV